MPTFVVKIAEVGTTFKTLAMAAGSTVADAARAAGINMNGKTAKRGNDTLSLEAPVVQDDTIIVVAGQNGPKNGIN